MAKAGVNLAVHSAVVTPSSRNWFLACSYPVSGSEPQCLLQVSNRFITSALLRQHSCEIAMRLGITFIDLHGFAELFKRFVAFSDSLQGATEIIANFGSLYRVTFCAECSLVASNCTGPVALSGKRVTEIELHLSRSGFDRDGLLVMRDGFLQLAVSPKSRAQIIMGVGITRVERNGLLVITDCFASFPLFHESVSHVVIGFRISRVDLERLL